jgi:hypothetical protein
MEHNRMLCYFRSKDWGKLSRKPLTRPMRIFSTKIEGKTTIPFGVALRDISDFGLWAVYSFGVLYANTIGKDWEGSGGTLIKKTLQYFYGGTE